jgi:hypothetical protein
MALVVSVHEFLLTFCNKHLRKKTPQGGKAFKTRNDTDDSFLSFDTLPQCSGPFLVCYFMKKADRIITCALHGAPSLRQRYVYLQGFLHILICFHHFKCNNSILQWLKHNFYMTKGHGKPLQWQQDNGFFTSSCCWVTVMLMMYVWWHALRGEVCHTTRAKQEHSFQRLTWSLEGMMMPLEHRQLLSTNFVHMGK